MKLLPALCRRGLCALLAVLLILSLRVSPAAAEGTGTLVFPDPGLYAALREELAGTYLSADDAAQSLSFSPGAAEAVLSLSLNNRRIQSLAGLEGFTGLRELEIANNSIEDLSPLAGLTGLTKLNAMGCAVTDAGCLAALAGLTELDLSKNRLYDGETRRVLRDLSGLRALTRLDLSGNLLLSAEGAEALTELRYLDLYDNAIHDFSPLAGLTRLESLYLGCNNESGEAELTGLEALRGLGALRILEFSENHTPELPAFLPDAAGLRELYADNNEIADFAPIGRQSALEVLRAGNNRLTSLSPLLGLSALRVLDLTGNPLTSLAGLLAEGEPVWPKLELLDVSENPRLKQSPETEALRRLAAEEGLDLGLDLDRVTDVSHLPHLDENGTAYVSYGDFDPPCDGVRDDWNAMACAHRLANALGCVVRADPDKTYHVFKPYRKACGVRTSVDWQGAVFLIHDEEIEQIPGRRHQLFDFRTPEMLEAVTITAPDWTVGTETRQLPQLREVLAPLAERGFRTFFCRAVNEDVRQFIRFGSDADNGVAMEDRFRVDAEGNLLNDVQWDFDRLTGFTLRPIPNETMHVRNGRFVTTAFLSRSEVPYTRGSKPIYFARGLQFLYCGNLEVSGIVHTLEPDVLSGSYLGFLSFTECVQVSLHDCTLFARKTNVKARSTYDLLINDDVSMEIRRVASNDILDLERWGITGTNDTKDILYDHCLLNRIDAHRNVYNLTVLDCELGQFSLTGKGTLEIRRCTVWRNNMILLRHDYGSTWDGQVNIIDCVTKYWGEWAPVLFSFRFCLDENGGYHDFGYPLRFPNVYVENLTVDGEFDTPKHPVYTLVPNWTEPTRAPEGYWPETFIVNGLHFANSEHMGSRRMQIVGTNEGGETGNYIVTDLSVRTVSGEELSRRLFRGEAPVLREPAVLRIRENNSVRNELEIRRDGEVLLPRQGVSGTLERLYEEPGDYEITLYSLDAVRHKDGNITLRFTLDNTASGMLAEGVEYSVTRYADRLEATLAVSGAAPECRAAAALYDAGGRLLTLRTLEPGTRELPLSGREASLRLFCADADWLPLCEPVQLDLG